MFPAIFYIFCHLASSSAATFAFGHHLARKMMSLSRLRDNRDFSHYSSSAECADEDKTLSSALSEADVEGSAVARSAHFIGFKKDDMEEGPAVEPLAADVVGPAVVGSAGFLINLDTFLYIMSNFATLGRIRVTFLQGFQSFFDTTKTFSKSFDVQATHRFFFLVYLFFFLL
ncbi:hypothetical protein E2C01_065764 [Portunus trituberculatus]|uniref:Uncharacterized protein n=1 Tax=Portunus trituberculatus TaxID=210409 RepID=A0A5B7HNG5_PORTR|nr:hypothetical protein [Portunus trituberculatus]